MPCHLEPQQLSPAVAQDQERKQEVKNRIYRGEITHKGDSYPGEHRPIIDKLLWDQVQAILAENRVDRASGVDAKQPSLLAGLIFDESGERLTPSHAVKKGTRYRYYVSRSLIVGTAKDNSTGRRIPAANLETLVITKLRSFLADEGAVLNVIREEHVDGAAQSRLIARGAKIAKEIESLTPDRIRAMLMTLISRVDIGRLRRDQRQPIAPDGAARVRLDRFCDATRDARQ
jgi:hypothetical protein